LFLSSKSLRTDCPFKLETDDLDNEHRVLLNAIIRVILRRMKNDDNDLKEYSLPLFMKQSTEDRDDHARTDLFDGSAKANLESLEGTLIRRDTKLNVHAPSNDEGSLMSDATSELTSQTYGRQTDSGGDVMPFTDLSGSSGPAASPMVRELLGNTIGRYHVFVGDLSPDVNDDILAMAFITFGSISDVRVMWDNNSGKSHGYGFLAFVDKADAEHAIAIMNGKRLGSREIRVKWANQEIQRVPPTTAASSHQPVTSGSAPAPSGSEYGRLLHGSLPLLGEPRNILVDEGFLEEVEALDYRSDVPTSGSTDPLEGFPGNLLSDPEDSTFSPDTLPYRKTVASPARIMASQARRKNGQAKFTCSLCTQTFTTNTNLKSKPLFSRCCCS
jgi:RNA recognition motif-containing protein